MYLLQNTVTCDASEQPVALGQPETTTVQVLAAAHSGCVPGQSAACFLAGAASERSSAWLNRKDEGETRGGDTAVHGAESPRRGVRATNIVGDQRPISQGKISILTPRSLPRISSRYPKHRWKVPLPGDRYFECDRHPHSRVVLSRRRPIRRTRCGQPLAGSVAVNQANMRAVVQMYVDSMAIGDALESLVVDRKAMRVGMGGVAEPTRPTALESVCMWHAPTPSDSEPSVLVGHASPMGGPLLASLTVPFVSLLTLGLSITVSMQVLAEVGSYGDPHCSDRDRDWKRDCAHDQSESSES
ncbi:hypothetical protein V8D89_015991 [Ganoderma adspersum]